YYDRANILLALGQPLAAVASAQAGLDTGIVPSMRRTFLLLIAQSYERAGSLDEAVTWYQRLLDESSLGSDQALALARMAAIRRDQLDPGADSLLQRLLAGYPATQHALAELEAANLRAEPIDPTIEGL